MATRSTKKDTRPAGYSGTPLERKLGIREGATLTLISAPPDFEELLDLPDGVTVRRQARGRCDLAIWFVPRLRDLESRIERIAAFLAGAHLWICWPKKASGVKTDVSENDVRQAGLANGLVDYKIVAIDATWSGLKFAPRREAKQSRKPPRT